MNIDLSGKTALVTGSTEGIGYAIGKGLAQSGAAVILNGRKQEKVDAAAAKLVSEVSGARVRGIAGDVGTADGCAAVVSGAGAVDILINNAGVYGPQPFFEIPDAEWMRYFELNVMSGIRLSRALLPDMIARKWGRVVFISSESGIQIPPEMMHYGMTKTAQLAISRGLAELAAGSGVTVNTVLPGPTRSEGVEEFLAAMARQAGQSVDAAAAGFIREHRPTSLLGRFATGEEVANMVVYVSSTQASATNGAALRVDGGVVRSIL
jgi:NAD(P)-dependent dehydrogenase (short-subunit alcohol dehydrogenase family)